MDTKFFVDTLVMVLQMATDNGLTIYQNSDILVHGSVQDIAKVLGVEATTSPYNDDYFTHEVSFTYMGVRFHSYVKEDER